MPISPNHRQPHDLSVCQKFGAVVLDVFMQAIREAADAPDGQIELDEGDFNALNPYFVDRELPQLSFVVSKNPNDKPLGQAVLSAFLTLWMSRELGKFVDLELVAQVLSHICDGVDNWNRDGQLGHLVHNFATEPVPDHSSIRDTHLIEVAQEAITRTTATLAARPGG